LHTLKYIKRLPAGFMLVVFAISITPRIALHTWFAAHKDAVVKKFSNTGQLQFAKASFNCNCVTIVAESPFTEPGNSFEFYTFRPFTVRQTLLTFTFYSTKYLLYSLRGPPAYC
jgi:hypothetical protein